MQPETIIHTVSFRLKHPQGSPEEAAFLSEARTKLSPIPTVQDFQILRQVSAKNPYHFFFSMRFDDQAAYEAYNQHSNHVAFVKTRWLTEVAEFQEADYQSCAD